MSGLPPSTQAPEYVDIQKNWRRLGPIFRSPEIQQIIVRELVSSHATNDYFCNNPEYSGWMAQSQPADWLPSGFDSCDWRYETGRRGPHPAYFSYVKHAWCHWSATVNLAVARRWKPNTNWRVVCSEKHSSVVAGNQIFDTQFLALGIPAHETYTMATKQADSEDVTEYIDAGDYHQHSFWEVIYLLAGKGRTDVADRILEFLPEEIL